MKSFKLHIVILLILELSPYSFGQNYFELGEAKLIKSGVSTGLFSNVKQAFGAPNSESDYYSDIDEVNYPLLRYGDDKIFCYDNESYSVNGFTLTSGEISLKMGHLMITPNSKIDLNDFQIWGYEYNLENNGTRITIVFPPSTSYILIELLPVRGGTASERRVRSVRLGTY